MLSKEHGVIVGVVILLDHWLRAPDQPKYPSRFWLSLGVVTAVYLVAWFAIGRAGSLDVASAFYGKDTLGRLAIALPAIWRATVLLVWPASLSSDYSPQVLSADGGISVAALLGFCVAIGVPALILWCRRRAPAISFSAGIAAFSSLPTANLLYPSGIVLAERNLYLAVALPAALIATAAVSIKLRRGFRPAVATMTLLALLLGAGSVARLPVWRDNRSQLLTLLAEHPESYRAHGSAAAVLAGLGDTAGARREYRVADSLFSRDPYLDASRAIFLISIGDTTAAAPLVERVTRSAIGRRATLRARFLLQLTRGDRAGAAALADSARREFPGEELWYQQYR
jgi:hypothetical protein